MKHAGSRIGVALLVIGLLLSVAASMTADGSFSNLVPALLISAAVVAAVGGAALVSRYTR